MDPFMKAALVEAIAGKNEGGIPIGSVLVIDGEIKARGRNRRIQEKSPILHAEIDCLRDAGRLRSYRGAILYSTLMPCYLCAGAVVQFGIRQVVVGDSVNFDGAGAFMREHGVEVSVTDDPECVSLMHDFIVTHTELWNEDIGREGDTPGDPSTRAADRPTLKTL